ncbi:CDP-glycerol glycerophosphotransferase family protein [Enterococcus sp. CWB-B31]|uniref:CDP-glycerol glycerophosphotransferase family protein n=1 Tax=Enterococcus sp. CWB-B31 TaxID=2885159 RepID=UPI001E3F7180|nr:CDP-glycerol glycerophosphotransferase family protein [Enterococcus sp. CWB-B31]MCB5953552.1 CDP-glycerol glycerophosphotransferase family protein [Enterococcus sp. CWB-B31]
MKRLNLSELSETYAKKYDDVSIDEYLILYETRDGQSIVDSPLALFIELAKNPDYRNMKHIWVIDDEQLIEKNSIPIELRSQVKFVIRNTPKYIHYLLQAKYLITNSTFQSFFSKKEGQVYLNTWHGTPLKYMGFDISGNPSHSQNVLRNLLMTDFILSPNSHTTNIFAHSYKLKGIYNGTVLETGYPRIDFFKKADNDEYFRQLKKDNLIFDRSLPTILYMPTWRGESIKNPTNDIEQLIHEMELLTSQFHGRYNVFLKVHPYMYNSICKNERIKKQLVPDYWEPNYILSITDVLITDFSSSFVDFLITSKPIIFYVWDMELYEQHRGTYWKMDELPGDCVFTVREMIQAVNNLELCESKHVSKYREFVDELVPYEDGNVSKRIIERVFKGQQNDSINEIILADDKKKKILFYSGGLLKNGITSSFLNLLDRLDYQKLDVSVLIPPVSDSNVESIKRINSNVRLIFKSGRNLYSKKEKKQLKKDANNRSGKLTKAFKRESSRVLSGIKFDSVIDYSGYSPAWARIVAYANAQQKIIYQHNELAKEIEKRIDGNQPHGKRLNEIFWLYKEFDKVNSVSKSLMEINYKSLRSFLTLKQVSYTGNIISISSQNEEKKTRIDNRIVAKKECFSVEDFGDLPHVFANYKDINITCGENLRTKPGDILSFIAEALFSGKYYYKIILNSEYLGWIEQKYLPQSVQKFEVSKQRVNIVASLKRNNDKLIYRTLPTKQEELSKGISYVRYLSNRYVWVKEICSTQLGAFCHIYDWKKSIGWIKKECLTNQHTMLNLSPSQVYFLLKNSRTYTCISQSVIKERSTLLLDRPLLVDLYSEPKGIMGHKLIISSYPLLPSNNYIINVETMVNNELWVQIVRGNQVLGWSKKQSLKLNQLSQMMTVQNDLLNKKETQVVIENDSRKIRYVFAGRFSPEKNHQNLIMAFNEISKMLPNAKLYLLGEGPLLLKMEKLVYDLNLTQRVIFLGQTNKPFPILELMDILVVPSFYEGQPMIILEALALGLKIVATDIPQNRNLLDNNYGLLSSSAGVEDLKNAMLQVLNSKLKFKRFDVATYNENALNLFYKLINMSTESTK